jgi:predicted nuclease with TOPRIM domain
VDADLIAALSGAAGLGGAAGGALVAWRKAGAESEAVAVKTLRSVIEELRAELGRKQAELDRLRERVDAAENRVEELFQPLEPDDAGE